MSLTTEQPRLFYVSIYSNPEFENFSYHFDYVTIIVLASFICYIPTVYATIKMVLFQHPQKSSTDIHPYVYKSFLCMQVSKLMSSILELIVIRIPQTTILTSYYSTLERDSPLRIFTAACFSLHNLSQLFTVLFCLIRLLVFLNPQARFETYRCIFWIWSIPSVAFCTIIYIIHFSKGVACMTFFFPFQYGAILVTSNLYESKINFWTKNCSEKSSKIQIRADRAGPGQNRAGPGRAGGPARNLASLLYIAVEAIFDALTATCVVVFTLLKLVKLKSMKQLSSILSKNTKAEKTLTITMFIILFPTLFDWITAVNSFSAIYFTNKYHNSRL
ncbi:hypothetical protein CRE_16295 [Caenorhabditis remanei]|uniref:Uncharacterized protein n=1 Tax=Caenorhabditis remanei TaxID=31234 RepID=E3N2L4_CAERE|nr:hypothetical protein CRE_16295 [Caenorhabditis remanei]